MDGTDSFKFLELLSIPRAGKFESPAWFITSNQNEYGPPPGHSDVASDVEACVVAAPPSELPDGQ